MGFIYFIVVVEGKTLDLYCLIKFQVKGLLKVMPTLITVKILYEDTSLFIWRSWNYKENELISISYFL